MDRSVLFVSIATIQILSTLKIMLKRVFNLYQGLMLELNVKYLKYEVTLIGSMRLWSKGSIL